MPRGHLLREYCCLHVHGSARPVETQIDTGLCVLGEIPILSQLLRKGFLEVDTLLSVRLLSVRMEEVIKYLRGCLEKISSG